MRAAIIGSSGYIGRNLHQALQKRGIESLTYSSTTTDGIDPITGLLAANFAFPENIDVVYYLAQSPHYKKVPEFSGHLLSVNCLAAVQVAQAALKSGVKKIIYASTGNVYSPCFSELSEEHPVRRNDWYSLSKVMAEDALNLFRKDIEITVVRVFGVYGPGQTSKLIPTLMDSVKEGRDIFVDRNPLDNGDHDGLKISLMFIDDAVNALIKLGGGIKTDPVINLAGPTAVSIRHIASMMGTLLSRVPNIVLSDNPREGNLIANITRLKQATNIEFTELATGLGMIAGTNQI